MITKTPIFRRFNNDNPVEWWNYTSLELTNFLLLVTQGINNLIGGRIAGVVAMSSPPTSGKYYLGDFIRNSQPSENGTDGSKYVVLGWVCVESGEPGTWVACRCLTGN